MTEEEARRQLGARIRLTRENAALTIDSAAALAPMSPVTWARAEQGHAVRGLTYSGIDRVLAWPPGTCRSTLDHLTASPLPPTPATAPTTAAPTGDPSTGDAYATDLAPGVRELHYPDALSPVLGAGRALEFTSDGTSDPVIVLMPDPSPLPQNLEALRDLVLAHRRLLSRPPHPTP